MQWAPPWHVPTRVWHSAHQPVSCLLVSITVVTPFVPELCVYGVEGLRVADASIMPLIIGGNTNAPTMVIGERCADFIASKYNLLLTVSERDDNVIPMRQVGG